MLPLTVTWAELGKTMGVDLSGAPSNPALKVMPGVDVFKALTEADQLKVLGSGAAHEAYKAGAVELEDFVGRKQSQRWGSMRYARSLRDIMGPEEARKWRQKALEVGRRARRQAQPQPGPPAHPALGPGED